MSSFLELYDALDIIGNGSFGIIRKVRRKSDGVILARKELNFERMSERDRKQIVAEVNILKDLHHDHIVRYHDRYVDRDAGILYILMEYCGGGDLSTVIKQAQKYNKPIPEDTIWNYFMQILLALHHCHHPNGHSRSGSGVGAGGSDADGKGRRAPILHRDLKPDNVFLDEANYVKLGDFGLSKALAQASFANTYVGTPYYMSPELMQEKAYDSKSDIWSLGCLIYELCSLKPPFHEAKTHAELSNFIRNGRIPPLPRGYSQSLAGIIKAMLNLNPAMRPSAAQLLQHERLELVFKVTETERMLATVKSHKSNVMNKESEVLAREAALAEKERHLATFVAQKDAQIDELQRLVSQLQSHSAQSDQRAVDVRIAEAVSRREEELRLLVMKREDEVAKAMARREEEIMDAVRKREEEVLGAWRAREEEIRKEVEARMIEVEEQAAWVQRKLTDISEEDQRLHAAREKLEKKFRIFEERKQITPLEDLKNLLEPLANVTEDTKPHATPKKQQTKSPSLYPPPFPVLSTPITRPHGNTMPSAMKGVVLTSTGECLATPSSTELVNLFENSPKVGLNFTQIFDLDADGRERYDSGDEGESPPPSPSRRERHRKENDITSASESTALSSALAATNQGLTASTAPPTRLRRPSIRTSSRISQKGAAASSNLDGAGVPAALAPSSVNASSHSRAKPLPHPHLQSSSAPSVAVSAQRSIVTPLPHPHPSPEYDFADEENLPSPFLKRVDRDRVPIGAGGGRGAGLANKLGKRKSDGNMLRAVAVANAAGRRGTSVSSTHSVVGDGASKCAGDAAGSYSPAEPRPSVACARKASEEARKSLLRP